MSSDSKLYLIGAPLDEEAQFNREAVAALNQCSLIFAEQKRVFEKQAKRTGVSLAGKEIYYLDNLKNFKEVDNILKQQRETCVGLVSDTGMPVLFDPGKEILNLCRKLKFQIHSAPSATSWATAACLSGLNPPFHLVGFLPQEKQARKNKLKNLGPILGHKILMETPYRFLSLCEEIRESFSKDTPVFLAWEIASPNEFTFWGSIDELLKTAESRGMKKGEFVLIIEDVRIES